MDYYNRYVDEFKLRLVRESPIRVLDTEEEFRLILDSRNISENAWEELLDYTILYRSIYDVPRLRLPKSIY